MHTIRIKETPKILLITNDYPPEFSGGISNVYFNLCKNDKYGLLKTIAPNTEAAKRFDKEFNLDTVRVRTPTKGGVLTRIAQLGLFFATAIIESFRNDVVAVWCGHVYLALIGYMMKKLRGIPYFLYFHGGETKAYLDKRSKAWVFKRIISNSAFLFCNSSFTKKQILSSWEYGKPIYVLNPGVDLERYYPIESSTFNRKAEEFVLLTVGTLVERKGHDKVIEALASLKEEIPGIRYLIVGTGPELERLTHLAYRESGLDSIVDFLGFADDAEMSRYFNSADVFIMPSRMTPDSRGTEGFGIVYLEANACGKPVIGGKSGGVPDAVMDGETGILVDPENVEDIKKAITWLYENPDERMRMGARGRERALSDFQWDGITERFIKIILKNLERA